MSTAAALPRSSVRLAPPAPAPPPGSRRRAVGACPMANATGHARGHTTETATGHTGSGGPPAVWDADAHICEPTTVWTDYAEPAFRDRVLQVRRRDDGTEAFYVGGREQ